MSVQTTSFAPLVDMPKVQLTYQSSDMSNKRNPFTQFGSSRSYTTVSNIRPTNAFQRSVSNANAMKCKEFSFGDISSKPNIHGFRKGRVVENKQTLRLESDYLIFEDSLSRFDTGRKKTEDFSISGQKVNLKSSDSSGPKTIPPREWVIERSRTLPVINDCTKAPYPSPITFFRPLRQIIKPEKLNVSLESLNSIDKEEKNNVEPHNVEDNQEVETKTREEDISFPRIDAQPEPVASKGVTVSLQTDDYLFYNENEQRPTTSQNARRVRYQPMKIITPTLSKKLPDLQENRQSVTKRDTPRLNRKAFPTLRVTRQPVCSSTASAASANKANLGHLSTSLPLLPVTRHK